MLYNSQQCIRSVLGKNFLYIQVIGTNSEPDKDKDRAQWYTHWKRSLGDRCVISSTYIYEDSYKNKYVYDLHFCASFSYYRRAIQKS